MKHPDSKTILGLHKGELPPEDSKEIREHLAHCDACVEELMGWKAVDDWMDEWEDISVSSEYAERKLRILDILNITHNLKSASNVGFNRPGKYWIWGASISAAAVVITILFQTFIWNPFGPPASIRAVFRLTSEAYAFTSGEALPDTILVLILDQDFYLSTPLLSGRYGFDELDDLAAALDSLGKSGQFRSLFVVGPDADNPVTFRTEMLQPLLDALGIDSISTGTGVVALENRGEWTAWITMPLQMPTLSLNQTLTFNQLISIPLEARTPLYSAPLSLNPLTLDISIDKWRWWRYSPTIRVTPSILKQRSMANLNVALLADLLSTSQAILTVNTDGNIIINRAVIPEYELRQALMRLRLLNPRISVLILVREDAGTDDPGYRVKEIIERLGIRVSVLIVRDP